MDSLKPCPFCGRDVKIESVNFADYAGSYFDNDYLSIGCKYCKFDMRAYPKGLGCTTEEKNELIRRWNKRT